MSLKTPRNYLKFEFCQVIYLRFCNSFYRDRKTFSNFCQINRINKDLIQQKMKIAKFRLKISK